MPESYEKAVFLASSFAGQIVVGLWYWRWVLLAPVGDDARLGALRHCAAFRYAE